MYNRIVCILFCTLFYQNSVLSAVTKYTFGRNSATITTGTHICANGNSTQVTLSVDAILNDKNPSRTNFGSSFDKRMKELDAKPGDHKGHILASAFGGPAETWNLAPQADNLNRKYRCRTSILNVWYDCEKFVRDSLDSGKLPVKVKVVLDYENKDCRPTHWSIDAKSPSDACTANHIANGILPFGICQKASLVIY
ncbi:uncharacterized protein LOC143194211 [Rhynchophorus ferrugineus]|uniref:uncharacterized protein LOC143194211 n=1 Tax=Rhynchophorus ferrugineus TaxID=354439 RepID=UPI003FCE1E8A